MTATVVRHCEQCGWTVTGRHWWQLRGEVRRHLAWHRRRGESAEVR